MTTISFKTLGCRLNQAETAAMRGTAVAAGCRAVPFGAPCDICVIHGCAVTARAEKNSWRLARAARRSGARRVIMAGCPTELADALQRSGADLLLRQREKLDPGKLSRELGCPDLDNCSSITTPLFKTKRALVRVQDGCDFHCAYCIVPLLRGPSRSRPAAVILEETRRLLDAGHLEIVLTGANLGCYNHQGLQLSELLAQMTKLPGLRRLRLSSIEITTVEKDVIDFMADSGILCRSLHLPLQSGSANILRRMGRRYEPGQYAQVAAYARAKLGAVGLGTDLLVGFPGETDRDFQKTEQMASDLCFNNLHIFSYSPRPGTTAAAMPGQIPETVKNQRQHRLIQLGTDLRRKFTRQWVGRRVAVLVEQSDRQGHLSGWTGEYLPAKLTGCAVCRSAPLPRLMRCVPYAVKDGVLLAQCGCMNK